ncbi:hypothetical protein ACL2XO_03260 [Sodalis sp. RH15]|uniref:hypothetical protein n=1 Tax=Sodalis sp. RH15 TaxID=3394330 RepID=UPI0039B544CE
MRPKTVGFYLLVFLILYCVALAIVTVLMTKVIVFIIGYLFFDASYFDWKEDSFYAFKAGVAGGIPLGIGCWILSKLKENKEKSSPSS